MKVLALYVIVDLFVALVLAYILLEARRAEGQDLHPIGTVLLCMLWPLSITAIGIAYLVSPEWFQERQERIAKCEEKRKGRR